MSYTTRTATTSGLAATAAARARPAVNENRADIIGARALAARKPVAPLATTAAGSLVPQRRAVLVDRTNVVPAPTAASAVAKRPALGSIRPKDEGADAPMQPMDIAAASARVSHAGPSPMPTSALPTRHDDIDLHDDDPQACSEIAEEIMAHFRSKELQYMVPENYLATAQPDITPKMRAILLDWLVEVHLKFKLLQETMFLTVSVIDRFLAKHPAVARGKLQLVGITAMLVASKYEEIYPPEVRDFIYICDRAYTRQEILDMEATIVATLDFALLAPYGLHFLRRFSKAANADLKAHTTAKYLLELAMVDYEAAAFFPSAVAAAALSVSLKMCGVSDWSSTMQFYTRYTEPMLLPVMRHINALHARSADEPLKAVHKKYSKTEFLKVAKTPALAL